jgi:hypothetical protein
VPAVSVIAAAIGAVAVGGFAIRAIHIRQPAIRRIAIGDAAVKTPKSWPSSLSSCLETLRANDRIVRRASALIDKADSTEDSMSRESRMTAGILLVTLPSVMYGGLTLLSLLTQRAPGIADNPMRHDLWRAGHAHAGVYLVLSLLMLRYVDEALLPPFWRWIARIGAPIAAILIPAAFFLSVASPTAKEPNALLNLAYIGALFLAAAVLSLGVGLIRAARRA